MANPDWIREELILALDLYYDLERKGLDARNPKIIALSSLLQKLPYHKNKTVDASFRNPNGVARKLSNFLPFDKNHFGKGSENGGKLDEAIWNEFLGKRSELKSEASKIKDSLLLTEKPHSYSFEDLPEQEFLVSEGGKKIYMHTSYERNPTLVKKKKKLSLSLTGKLTCTVCNFNFKDVYGELGANFIECHHIVPLHKLESKTKNSLDDLVLVCSNCHRMLHRGIETLTVERLKEIVQKNK